MLCTKTGQFLNNMKKLCCNVSFQMLLKILSNENTQESKLFTNVRYGSGTVAINILLPFLWPAILKITTN
jgi:hypothetical protein